MTVGLITASFARREREESSPAQQSHSSDCGRAPSVASPRVPGHPHSSVPTFAVRNQPQALVPTSCSCTLKH
jgi:hypothetical protein